MKRDYFWNTLGVFAQNAISPLLLVVITRINGIYDSGLFSFAFSLSVVFWTLGMWGGRIYQVSDIKQQFSNRSYIFIRLTLAVVLILLALLFSLLNHYSSTKTAVIVALVLFKALESIADAIYGVLQVHGKLFIVGKSLLYKSVLSFIVFTLLNWTTGSLLIGCLGIVLVNAIMIATYDSKNAQKVEDIRLHFSAFSSYRKEAVNILLRTAPLFLASLLSVLSLNIPRYFIDIYSNGEIAYFGIFAMPITLIVLVVSFILQPSVVHLSELYNHKRFSEFGKNVKQILFVTFLVSLTTLAVGVMVGIPILNWIFGINLAHYYNVLVIMLFGGMINAFVAVIANILTIMRRLKSQVYILFFTDAILLLVSPLIVQTFGLVGGALAFAGVCILQLILFLFVYVGSMTDNK